MVAGRRGPTPKPRDQRERRNTDGGTESTSVAVALMEDVSPAPWWDGPTTTLETVSGSLVEVPAAPEHVGERAAAAWERFWSTPEAAMIRPHHMASLTRLCEMYDEEDRLRRRVFGTHTVEQVVPLGMDGPAKDGELVQEREIRAQEVPGYLGIGSQGQLVESPEFKMLMKVRAEIRALEDRFAGTPLAEFNMGWQHAAMLHEQARAREANELAEAAAQLRRAHESGQT